MMTNEELGEKVREAVKNRDCIIIGGKTGSGKTELLKSCILESVHYYPDDAFIIVSNPWELNFFIKDRISLHPFTGDTFYSAQRMAALSSSPSHLAADELSSEKEITCFLNGCGSAGGFATIHAESGRTFFGMAENTYRLRETVFIYLEKKKDLISADIKILRKNNEA